jgi:hypothetical protein
MKKVVTPQAETSSLLMPLPPKLAPLHVIDRSYTGLKTGSTPETRQAGGFKPVLIALAEEIR